MQRVADELHDRMRRIGDAYLRERLADMEDLAERLLAALTGDRPPSAVPQGAILLARRLGPAELLDWHTSGIAGVPLRRAARRPRRDHGARLGHTEPWVACAACWRPSNR